MDIKKILVDFEYKKKSEKQKTKYKSSGEKIFRPTIILENTKEDLGKSETPEKKKRVVTETTKWQDFCKDDLETETQWSLLIGLLGEPSDADLSYNSVDISPEKQSFLLREIHNKINGYKQQDIKKDIYDPSAFISLDEVLQKLFLTELNCFYCQGAVKIWYEMSRDPFQWTLERINNKFGHNRDNVEIACLQCNLKRRCMYYERYIFTKQVKFVKQGT